MGEETTRTIQEELLPPWPKDICAVPGCGYSREAHGVIPHQFISGEQAILIMEAGGTVRRQQEVA